MKNLLAIDYCLKTYFKLTDLFKNVANESFVNKLHSLSNKYQLKERSQSSKCYSGEFM